METPVQLLILVNLSLSDNLEVVVRMSAVLDNINTHELFLFRDPQADGYVNQPEYDKGSAEGPDKGGAYTGQLDHDDL